MFTDDGYLIDTIRFDELSDCRAVLLSNESDICNGYSVSNEADLELSVVYPSSCVCYLYCV